MEENGRVGQQNQKSAQPEPFLEQGNHADSQYNQHGIARRVG